MSAFFQIIATLAALRLVLALSSDPESGVVLASSRHGTRPAIVAAIGLWGLTVAAAAVAMELLDLFSSHFPGYDLDLRIVCGLHVATLALRSVVDAFRGNAALRFATPLDGRTSTVFAFVLRSMIAAPSTFLLAGAGFGLTGACELVGSERVLAILVMPTVAFVWHLIAILPLASSNGSPKTPTNPGLPAAGR